MSERNRFVVEVVGSIREPREVTVTRVCEALGLDESRAALLVARMPGVITKPAGEDRAMKVALRLQGAGVPALHRPLADHEDPIKTGERPAAAAVLAADAAAGEMPSVVAEPRDEVAPPDAVEPRDEVAPPAAVEPPAAAEPRAAVEPPPATVPPAAPVAPEAPAPAAEAGEELDPKDVPSLDATHHEAMEPPYLTPVTAAGFGAADVVLPTETPPPDPRRTRPRATFVEAGSTAVPTPLPDDPAITMVRPASASPTPPSDGAAAREGRERPLTPVSPALEVGRADAGAAAAGAPTAVPRREPAADRSDPAKRVYRQTRSAAEPPLTLSAPPEDVLKRSGVPESELPNAPVRSRGRFGRHLAAQVALPGLLTWALTAVALWLFLGEERQELFVVLAAASAVAALIGSLVAALGTMGVARDVVRLRDEARRVAMGDLTAPVASNREDELGELAGSLERIRLSLQEGLERLRKRRG